jgi:polyhydroxyalkanoate synthesis repressor PhaR
MELLIKRYPNRKLYDVARSKYVNLPDILMIVREGNLVRVVDNTTAKVMTSYVLAAALAEEEKNMKGPSDLAQKAIEQILVTAIRVRDDAIASQSDLAGR